MRIWLTQAVPQDGWRLGGLGRDKAPIQSMEPSGMHHGGPSLRSELRACLVALGGLVLLTACGRDEELEGLRQEQHRMRQEADALGARVALLESARRAEREVEPVDEPRAPTAREVSDMTMRRITKAMEIAQAKKRVASLVRNLSRDGHRLPDNSIIQASHGGMPMRIAYESWLLDQSRGPVPAHLRYKGNEGLGGGSNHLYDFAAIKAHARFLLDPSSKGAKKVKFWPGGRNLAALGHPGGPTCMSGNSSLRTMRFGRRKPNDVTSKPSWIG